MQKEIKNLTELVNSPDLQDNLAVQFIKQVLSEKLKEKDLPTKFNLDGNLKEVKLVFDYPSSDTNSSGLYSCYTCDKSTGETYMSFYTKDKVLFMAYITNFIVDFL